MGGNLVETLIGAAVLAVAALFMLFAYRTADIGQVDGYQLTARFDQIDGINVGTDVMLAGVKIGSVLGKTLDKERYQAVVRLSVEKDVQLPADSSIKVTSSGLLGESYLSIEPGGDEDIIADGGEIQYTQGSVSLIDLIGKAIYSQGGNG